MPQMARRPFIKNTMGQLTQWVKSLRQAASEKPIYMANSSPTAMVNHSLHFVPILTPKPISLLAVQHAVDFSGFGLPIPVGRDGGMGGQSHFHHCEPGRWLRRRPVPCERRKMRRARRSFLLPSAEFRTGHRLPSGRSRRNYRLGAEDGCELRPFRLQRIRRDHLPALNHHASSPHERRGNDVTQPREAGKKPSLTSAANQGRASGMPRACAEFTCENRPVGYA